MEKSHHRSSFATIRVGDLTEKEIAFVRQAADATSSKPRDIVMAALRMAHEDASRLGVPWFVPKLKRFM